MYFSGDSFDEYRKYLSDLKKSSPRLKQAYLELDNDDDDDSINDDERIEKYLRDVSLSEKEFVELIALCRKKGASKIVGGGNTAANDALDRMYSNNPYRFIDEFLQNADDCTFIGKPKIDICIDRTSNTIGFSYNEVGFTRKDIWAITSYGNSTKHNEQIPSRVEEGRFFNEKTGRKGQGFKAVFSLDAQNVIVHIRSNGFSFRLDKNIGIVLPIWENDENTNDGKTHVIVELIQPNFELSNIYSDIREKFCIDSSQTLFSKSLFLFLHKLEDVRISYISEAQNESFNTEFKEDTTKTKYQNPFVINQEKAIRSGISQNGTFYAELFQQGTIRATSQQKTSEIPVVRYTKMVEERKAYRNYTIIAPIITDNTSICWRNGSLFCTFPMPLHSYPIPIAIDAPFELRLDRAGIEYCDEKIEGHIPELNSYVVKNIFTEQGNLYHSFLCYLKEIDGIRMDKYFDSDEAAILFNNKENEDENGNHRIKPIYLSDISKTVPILHLYADNNNYVSINDAFLVEQEVYHWVKVETLFQEIWGDSYRHSLLSEQYVGSKLFTEKSFIQKGFSNAINEYLDVVEQSLGIDSAEMVAFVNKQLYPFLHRNLLNIMENDITAINQMNIVFSKVYEDGTIKIVRENLENDKEWYHSKSSSPLSINRYRILEASTVDISIISDLVEQAVKTHRCEFEIEFLEKNYLINAKNKFNEADWQEIRDFIEAGAFWKVSLQNVVFPRLSHYVLSSTYDSEYNAYRESGVAEVIPDEDIIRLSKLIGTIEQTVRALQDMGTKKANDILCEDGSYLALKKDTLQVLASEIPLSSFLDSLKHQCQQMGKTIHLDYKQLLQCTDEAIIYFLTEENALFEKNHFEKLCNSVQAQESFWQRGDENSNEILLRACAGSNKNNPQKQLRFSICQVLERHLEECAKTVLKNRKLGSLEITNGNLFQEVPSNELQVLLQMLGQNEIQGKYYIVPMDKSNGNSWYLCDSTGNIFLGCDENGDYKKAFAASNNSKLNNTQYQAINEMECQYQSVYEQIILPIIEAQDHNLERTYSEIEKYFDNYSKHDIICILSWFRSQGYANALGNGNQNSEREIDSDYKNTPWRFVYEFIQNVDDCSYSAGTPELQINIDSEKNNITFEYNEDGFTLNDVKALTKFGDSNKPNSIDAYPVHDGIFDREKTGRKGRGFKSVFSLPGQNIVVYIHSNGFHFKLIKCLSSIIPIWDSSDAVEDVGTKITVEGFEKGYLSNLSNEINTQFGFHELSAFCSSCPLIFLRKLQHVSIKNGSDIFTISFDTISRKYSEDEFELSTESNLIAGILNNGKLTNSVAEKLDVKIQCPSFSHSFQAIRYTEMFELENNFKIASIFAPIFTSETPKEVWQSIKTGSLYRLLPLSNHPLSIPLSINAPFEINSGRTAIEDDLSNVPIVDFIFQTLFEHFYFIIREIKGIHIGRYVPEKSDILFSNEYTRIRPIDIKEITRPIPLLLSYSKDKYVSYNDAILIPLECFDWYNPELLCRCFVQEEKVLVNSRYIKNHGIPHVPMHTHMFVDNLNSYLEQLNETDEKVSKLLSMHIYPYLDKFYDTIRKEYSQQEKIEELAQMRIFVFEMADGNYIRESANTDTVWIEDAPSEYFSFGKYRNVLNSSIGAEYSKHPWINKHHECVRYRDAFTRSKLKEHVNDWESTVQLLQTILYYDIKQAFTIPYLTECVLSEELDPAVNWFREGFKKTGDTRILRHIITKEDLDEIYDVCGSLSMDATDYMLKLLYSMGLKRADDFFECSDEIYKINPSTLALLSSYCTDTHISNSIISTLSNAFRQENPNANTSFFRIQFEKVQNCHPSVVANIFKHRLTTGDYAKKLAEDFCQNPIPDNSIDYVEAFLRAASICTSIGDHPDLISIRLSDVIERKLGECLQSCIKSNKKSVNIHIETDIPFSLYQSADIDKALKWMNDERSMDPKERFITADIREAFPENKSSDDCFLYDDSVVILNAASPKNSLLRFVQTKYKKTDSSFQFLLEVVMKQNRLKEDWTDKKEYISELAEFRKFTSQNIEILVPNYEDDLNNATGNAIEYIIPELLQNINDCKPAPMQKTRTLDVDINEKAGTMQLIYDEEGFSFQNVYSITAIGQSSKHDESEGEKGLGFKKVFTLFKEVQIYSNGFAFSLTAEKSTVPQWINDIEKQQKYLLENKTVMLFTVQDKQLDKMKEILKAWQEVVQGRYTGSTVSPLFLENIDFIRLAREPKFFSRTNMLNNFIYQKVYVLSTYKEILERNNIPDAENLLDEFKMQLKTRKKCAVMENEDTVEEYLNSLTFEIALPKKCKDANDGCIYSTLPTKIATHSKFYFNLALELSTGRNEILDNSAYNTALFRAIFEPFDNDETYPSVFTYVLEQIANENPDVFMPNYFPVTQSNFDEFVHSITNGMKESNITKSFKTAAIFGEFGESSRVSISKSYSIPPIICQYIHDVDYARNNLVHWLEEHSLSARDYALILPDSETDCEKLEKFAEFIRADEGHFPLKEKNLDLEIEYFKDEFGFVGGEMNEESRIYGR